MEMPTLAYGSLGDVNGTSRPSLPSASCPVPHASCFGVVLLGLIGTVAGAWAIIRFISRQTRPEALDAQISRAWRGLTVGSKR